MSDTRPPPVVVANHFQTPYNYKVLLGANVACFTDDGEYAGYNGVVHCVNFSATVALDQSESNVAFDIWLGPGVFQMWKPIQLYQGLLLYDKHCKDPDPDVANKQATDIAADIANLVALNDRVHEANMLLQKNVLCRVDGKIRLGRVSLFRVKRRVPTWTVSFEKGPDVDLTRDEVIAASELFDELVNTQATKMFKDSDSVPSLVGS